MDWRRRCSREFGHRFAGMGVLILLDPDVRQDFALDHDLCARNGVLGDRLSLDQLDWASTQAACHA